MPIKVAIVEDNIQICEGLKLMVESSDELFCRYTFNDAETFNNKFKHLDVDVVLMDIKLPGHSGIECVEKSKKIRPEVQFLMCTDLEDPEKIFSALRVGATGYMIKNTTSDKLVEAIKEIHGGGSPMSPQIARKVTEAFTVDLENSAQVISLTKREREIIDLLAAGYPYKEVADKLKISIETVRTRVRDIYTKLHVHNKTEAINKIYPRIKT